jgi:HEAT repeat protein/cyclophilin family peptidyl-prolyl cis-trans isomerase
MNRAHRALVLVALASALDAACATAPPPAPIVPVITYEQKMAWILRLEDERLLKETPPPPEPAPVTRGRQRPVVTPPPPPMPDLTRLVGDDEARVRRRAALAIGRVGLADGLPHLLPRLHDPEAEVRQMAAFALGLIGDKTAIEPLRAALDPRLEPSPLVQGRAAEALGLLGDQASAPAIGAMLRAIVQSGALAKIDPDDLAYPLDPSFDAFRLGVFALTRLKAFDALAGAVLDQSGQPAVTWWPVAYALGRTPDKRALPALLTFMRGNARQARIFAARGLGTLKDPAAIDVLLPYSQGWRNDLPAAIAAVRALGEIGNPRVADTLVTLVQVRDLPPNLRLETVAALGALRAPAAITPLLDLIGDPWPTLRAASLRALRDIDLQQFLVVLSGLEPDRHWSVRAAIAALMGTLPADMATARLTEMLNDPDQRVIPSVLDAFVKLRAPQAEAVLLERLKADDVVVRATSANGIGELKPAAGPPALVEAYKRAQPDGTYVARTAALAALTKYGAAAATPSLQEALQDRDWAVRVRAASLLKGLDPSVDVASAIRPAPRRAGTDYGSPQLVAPAVSPHVYIDTDKGTIQIELAVLDAPLTSVTFMTLARSGFFNNVPIHRVVPNFVVQDGDPRGDGEGGPGYTIRDELNELPYLRGTVGMALDWADTGGSQFFITHSPQPHLDARYTVFGRVVQGFDVIDRLQQWDTIKAVRVWDGKEMTGK